MRSTVIIGVARTPFAKASPKDGYFRDVRADELSAHVIQSLVDQTGVEPQLVEDVRWGCVQQFAEQGTDMARTAVLLTNLPVDTCGVTVNRNCGSGLQAINDCAMSIAADCEDVQIAGGVEHMHHLPMTKEYDPPPGLFRRNGTAVMHMGMIAEYLAGKYRISRERQDEFALRSHLLAAKATENGQLGNEIVPTWGRDASGRKVELTSDQAIRPDSTIEALAALPPAFNPAGGCVTAGNSSPTSVGAAGVLLMSEDKANELGLKPLARIRAMAVAGVDPAVMGIGPVRAVHKVLKRAGLSLDEIGSIEVHEAFAAQALSVLKLLDLDFERVNLRGGALAIGHPLGASGARIAGTLIHRMRDEDSRFGLATLCIGGGQGVATIFERCDS